MFAETITLVITVAVLASVDFLLDIFNDAWQQLISP